MSVTEFLCDLTESTAVLIAAKKSIFTSGLLNNILSIKNFCYYKKFLNKKRKLFYYVFYKGIAYHSGLFPKMGPNKDNESET